MSVGVRELLVGFLSSSAAERDVPFSRSWDGCDEEVTLNCPSFLVRIETLLSLLLVLLLLSLLELVLLLLSSVPWSVP